VASGSFVAGADAHPVQLRRVDAQTCPAAEAARLIGIPSCAARFHSEEDLAELRRIKQSADPSGVMVAARPV